MNVHLARYCHVGFSTLLLLLSPAAGAGPAPARDENENLAKVAIVGSGANVDAFVSYKCRFRHTKAQARSVEDAMAGRFINATSYESQLVVDGEKTAYRGFTPEAPPDMSRARPVPGKKGMFVSPKVGDSDRYLADGSREMRYSPQLQAMGLWSKEKISRGIASTPLDMLAGPRARSGPDVLAAQPDQYELTGEGMSEIDGHPVVIARLHNKKYDYTLRYAFDAGRGYLPIRMETFQGDQLITRNYIQEARECRNSRWFPERCIAITTPAKEPLCGVTELQVLELDPDYRASAEDFAFRIPAGTEVNDPEDARKRFRLKQDETVSIDDLPGLFDMLDRVPTTPLMDTAIPHRRTHSWMRWLGGGVGLCVALAALVYLIGRWRKRRVA